MNKGFKAMHHRGIITFVSGIILLLSPCAHALTFWAPNTKDTTQLMSLRGAVIAANAIGGNNTILLGPSFIPNARQTQPWVCHLTLQGANEDQAKTGDLDITRGNLTIIGTTSNVVIDATGLGDRVFQVFPNASLTLKNVTITGGTAPTNAPTSVVYYFNGNVARGGGIYNSGSLVMQNCSIVKNSSGRGGYFTTRYWSNGLQGGYGGGIYNEGYIALNGCIIDSNSSGQGADAGISGFGADGGYGGGICNFGYIYMNNCTIINNSSGDGGAGTLAPFNGSPGDSSDGGSGGNGGQGGGVFNGGYLDLYNCTIADNLGGDAGNGESGGAGGDGGGICNWGHLNLNTCTLSGNVCGNGGIGGNSSYDTGGDGGNGGSGGGIFNLGMVNIFACTIVLDQAGIGGNAGNGFYPYLNMILAAGGNGGNGGGIFNGPFASTVIRNSLIALNIPNLGGLGGTNWIDGPNSIIGAAGATGTGYDINGPFTSQGFNLISIGDGGTGFTNGVDSDQVGTDANPINPVLGPLQWNGGPTPTHALLPGSPAINQGFSFGLHTDQRGSRRPYPYPGIPTAPSSDGSDIGAFELQGH